MSCCIETCLQKAVRAMLIPLLLLGVALLAPAAFGQSNLSGTYRIQTVGSGLFWHEDGGNDKLVSTRYWADDDYTRFILEKQDDGSYRVKVKADGLYLHVHGEGDKFVSTRVQPGDNYTRFFFEPQQDGSFRIKVKADNQYLHEPGSGDKLVSTRFQSNDQFARFNLLTANSIPGNITVAKFEKPNPNPLVPNPPMPLQPNPSNVTVQPAQNAAVSFWLGLPVAGDPTTLVFNVPVPNDVAQFIRRNDAAAPGAKTFNRTIAGTSYTFFQNDLGWDTPSVARGGLSFDAGAQGLGITWQNMSTDGNWTDFKRGLDSVAKPYIASNPNSGWFKATVTIVSHSSTTPPNLRLNLGATGPDNPVAYWLGVPVPGDPKTLVFNVAVPADVAAMILRKDAAAPGAKTFERTIDGQKHTFFQNDVGWNSSNFAQGNMTFNTPTGIGQTWLILRADGLWNAFKNGIESVAEPYVAGNPNSGWFKATPTIVALNSATPPSIRLSIGSATPINPVATNGPVDGSSSDPVTNMAPFVNPDGSLDVAWRRTDGQIFISNYSGQNWQSAQHSPIRNALPLLGGFTRDDAGNGYLLVASDEQVDLRDASGNIRDARLRRPNIAQVLRVPRGGQGALLADLNTEQNYWKWGIYNPIVVGARTTARLAYGNGTLAAAFAHNIPGADALMHNTGTLLAVDTNGASTYNGGAENHTMANFVWFDGANFVKVQEGDQGILMSRLTRQGTGQWTWSGDKLVYRHQKADPNNPGGDLEEYVRFGSVANVGDQYALTFAAKPGQGWAFGIVNQEWLNSVQGAGLWMVKVPKSSFESLPTFSWPANEVGAGVTRREFATPPGTSNYTRPNMVDLKNGTFIVVCEQWTTGQRYEQTVAMLIDGNGNVLRGPQTLAGNPRIQRCADAFLLNNSAGFIAGDNPNNRMLLHLVDASLNLQTHALSCQ